MVLLVDVVAQVSRVQEIHQQEKALPVLERKLHVHDKEVGVGFEFGEKLFFVHNWAYTAFGDDSGFIDDFKGVDFFCFFLHDFPHASESAFADDFDEIKVALVAWMVKEITWDFFLWFGFGLSLTHDFAVGFGRL